MKEDYDVPEYDWESLIEIKRMIKGNKYKELSQVKEHLDWLESMANKISQILGGEQGRGIVDLDTGKFSAEIRKTYDALFDIYEKMLEDLPSHHEEVKKKKEKKVGFAGTSTSDFKRF